MRISDWSSDVCSSDLRHRALANQRRIDALPDFVDDAGDLDPRREGPRRTDLVAVLDDQRVREVEPRYGNLQPDLARPGCGSGHCSYPQTVGLAGRIAEQRRHHGGFDPAGHQLPRSEEHTSELQSLMRISYAVFCLKKKTNTN